MLTIIYFFLGASLGSFIGLICDRFPEKSIIFPSSHCSHCKHQLRFFEMIPILSQLFLRSRCRSCQTSIPLRYLFMELFCGFNNGQANLKNKSFILPFFGRNKAFSFAALSSCTAVCGGGFAGDAFKLADEMVWVCISAALGNFRDGQVTAGEQ